MHRLVVGFGRLGGAAPLPPAGAAYAAAAIRRGPPPPGRIHRRRADRHRGGHGLAVDADRAGSTMSEGLARARPSPAGGAPTRARSPRRSSSSSRQTEFPKALEGATLAEAVDVAYERLAEASPREMAAFWTTVSSRGKRGWGRGARGRSDPRILRSKLEAIFAHTMRNVGAYGGEELSRVVSGFAAIAGAVGRERGGKGRRREEGDGDGGGGPRRVLRALLVGDDKTSTRAERVFGHLAASARPKLEEFAPRDLSALIRAFGLVEGVADGSKTNKNLRDALEYAAAPDHRRKLFGEVAARVAGLEDLEAFAPRDLRRVVEAYASARDHRPRLFKRIVAAAIARREEFDPRDAVELLRAYARNGQIQRALFESLAPKAAELAGECRAHTLAVIARTYAVADVDCPELFGDDFVEAVLAKRGEFTKPGLSQLHQFNLWRKELGSDVRLPPSLQERCLAAFSVEQNEFRLSELQYDVVSELRALNVPLLPEELTETGYSLDALVEADGAWIGVEVDGPHHFVGRNKPTGSTLLKRRQVAALEGIRVLSVPHWEWEKLGEDRGRRRNYLSSLLALA